MVFDSLQIGQNHSKERRSKLLQNSAFYDQLMMIQIPVSHSNTASASFNRLPSPPLAFLHFRGGEWIWSRLLPWSELWSFQKCFIKKFISNLFLKNSTNPDQMLRRFQNKSACLFFSPSLMTRGSIIYSSWPESSSLMRWVAWPGTGEGGIKAPAPVEWLAVWGLDAHHHGAAAQLSGGCDALDNTQRSFHHDYQNIRYQKKEYQQPWEKTC